MAKITRATQKVFGGDGSSDNFAKFGSLVAGAPIKTKDIATIQSLAAWDEGWQDAIYGANKNLLLEDLNAFSFLHSRQLAYLLQQGIAEWDSGTTYYTGSLVMATDGSGDVYLSLQDNNLANAIPGHAGNAFWSWWNPSGTGSGLDADTVDGFHASASVGANQLLALGSDSKFPAAAIPPRSGDIVQVVKQQLGTVATGSGTIPTDNTIPQVGEGNQFLTVSITPQNAANRLIVEVVMYLSNSDSNRVIGALFRDGAANALAVGQDVVSAATNMGQVVFRHEVVAGSVFATTFTVRGGSSAGVTTFNGESTVQLFGGVLASSIFVTEIAA